MNFDKEFDSNSLEFKEPRPTKATSKSAKPQNLTEEIKSLIKVEAAKAYSQMQMELSEKALKIIEDLALGLTDAEVIEKYKISSNEMEYYWTNPAFVAEYNKKQFNVGHVNEAVRLRGQNRVLGDLLAAIINDPVGMISVPMERKVDLYMKYSNLLDKQIKGDKPSVQIDAVQIIQNFIKDEKRIKTDKKGQIIIASEYEVLDDVIEVEKNSKGIYEEK